MMLKHDIIRLLDSFVSTYIDGNRVLVNPLHYKAYLEVWDNEMHIIDIFTNKRTIYPVNDLHEIIEVWSELMELNEIA
jgi:hypothetical protein